MIIIPLVLYFTINAEWSIPMLMLSVGLGELIACGVIGTILFYVVKRYGDKLGFATKIEEKKNADNVLKEANP